MSKSASELNPFLPSSPYAASKASSDHLVMAWNKTFDFPAIITNCSNNYGPFQHPEKFIPHIIISALCGKKFQYTEMANKLETGYMLKIISMGF